MKNKQTKKTYQDKKKQKQKQKNINKNKFFKNLRVTTAYRYSPVPFLVKPATPMRYVPSFRLLNVILVVSVLVFIVLVVFGSPNERYVIS